MSEASVDTRIVEAKFDSAQFEKGVDKTVKKLDELKKSLELEDTGKSIADMTDKASKSLKQLEDRFTSFAGMIKQKLLSGIADEIVGVFFKIKNSFESLVSSLSIGQIGTGKSKYEQMLTSVRTMIAAGDNENAAYEAIEKLGIYSDQTSYSLDQMTSALSKMRAAGVDLGTGTKAVQGIANACAAAGVNATDAARAFYNLSQSYSSGYLKYTDYRSLELLNMTTISFKEQMLEAMEAAGTLKKVSDGVYQTINKNDKKVVANKKVTVKNLTDSLKYNIMNTESMNKLFGEKFFFGEEEWRKYKTNYNTVAEAAALAKKDFNEVAVDAYLAAREARSFTDVLNTLKDVISTGWANSFELIFGRLGEATDFFTWLTENNLAEAIYAISEFRNLVLGTWNDYGGRESLMAALENIDNFLGRIFEKLGLITMDENNKDLFETMFNQTATEAGEDLYQYTLYFQRFTEKMDAWLTDERATRIATILSTIGKVVSTFFRALGMALKFALSLFDTFEPVLAAVIDGIAKIVDKVNGMFNMNDAKDGLDSIQFGLDNILNVAGKLVGPLTDIVNFLSEVALFIVDLTAGTVVSNIEFLSDTLGFFIELFGGKSAQQAKNGTGVIDGIKKDIIELGNACKEMFGFVKDFFHNLYEDLRLVFGLREAEEGEEGGFFSKLADFFKTNEFITKISDWVKEVPNKIAQLGKDLWNTVDEFLFGKKVVITKPSGKNNVTSYRIKTGFSKFLDQAVKDVKKWFDTTLPNKVKEIWNKIDEFFFGKKVETVIVKPSGKVNESTVRVKEGFSAWLDQAIKDVKDWIKNMPEKVTELWNTVIDAIFYRDPNPKEVNPDTGKEYGPNERVKTGFLVWLEALPGKLWGWISNDLPKILKSVWDTVIGWIFGPTMKEIALIDPTIKQEKDYNPNKRVGTAFSKWLESIPENIKNWIENDLSTTLANIWNTIINFIFGEPVDPEAINPETGETYGPNVRVKEGFSKWLDETVKSVSAWIKSVPDKIKNIWDIVIKAIFGNSEEEVEAPKITVTKPGKSIDPKKYGFADYEPIPKEARKSIIDTAKEFVDSLGIDIGKIISELPAGIINNISFGFDMLDILLKNVTEWFGNKNDETMTSELANQVKDEEGNTSPLLIALVEFGKKIKELFINTIPAFIKEAFIWIGSKASGIWDGLYSAFTGTEATTEIGAAIRGFGEKIRKAIENLPIYIQEGLNWVKNNLLKKKEKVVNVEDLLVNNKPWVKTDILGKNNRDKINTEMLDEVEQMQYDFKDTSKLLTIGLDTEDPFNFGEWISEVGKSLVDILAELGPYIVEGLNKVFKWIGDGLSWLTNVFNKKAEDESISQALENEVKNDAEGSKFTGLIGALKNIGETIKNLITTIIPDFVTSGVKVLSEEIPKIMGGIGNIFSDPKIEKEVNNTIKENSKTGLERTGKEEMEIVTASVGMFGFGSHANTISMDGAKDANKQSKTIKEIALDTVDNFAGIIGGLKDLAVSDTGKTIALLVAVSFVLSKIKDMLHFGDDLKDAAKAAKWEAIKVAVYFIVGLLSYLTVLASTGSEDQLNAVYDMFTRFESFADKLMHFVEVLGILKTATTGLKAAGSIWGKSGGSNNIVGFGAGLGYAGGKAVTGLATASIAGSIVTESIQSWIGDLSASFASLNTGFESLNNAFGQLEEIKTNIEGLDGVIGDISGFLVSLRHVFEEKKITESEDGELKETTEDFKNEFEGIMATFTELSGITANFKNAVSGKDIHATEIVKALTDLMDLRDKMSEFADYSMTEDFEAFKYAIASLGSALSMFGSGGITAESVSDKTIDEVISAVINIIKNEQIEAFARELDSTGSTLPDGRDIYRYAEKLVLIAGAVGSIGDAAKGITTDTGKNIETLFETISSINFDEYTDNTEGASKITKFAQNFGVIGNAIGTFANEANKFTADNVKITEDAINLTVRLMQALSYYAQGTLDKVWSGDASIEQFGFNFNTFAEQMKSGLDKLAGANVKYDQTALEQAMFAFRSIVVSYSQMNQETAMGKKILAGTDFTDVAKGLTGDDGLINALVEFLQTISSNEVPNIDENKYETITRAMHFITQLGNFAYQSHGVTFSTEMNDLANGLKGNNNPFVSIFNALNDINGLTLDENYDNEKIIAMLDAFGSLMSGIASLATYTKGSYVNDAGKWYVNDLMNQIGELFISLHAHFSDMQIFFNDIESFDMGLINKASEFFNGLNSLGSALNYFSDRKIFTGVENLEFFDWQGFMQNLKDAMALEFNEEDGVYMPKITPVLEISDDFIYKANQIRSMLGYSEISLDNKNGEYNINNETSLDLAKSINIPTPIDYTNSLNEINNRLDTVNNSIRYMNNDLTRMAFIINGREFAATVGPDIDEYLGEYSVALERVNGK